MAINIIPLFIMNENPIVTYFKDLNVPIAYILLTIGIFLICHNRMPKLRFFFFWVMSGLGLAFLFDVVYEYQAHIFILHDMTFQLGLLELLFLIPTYVFIVYIWKFGNPKKLWLLIFPIIAEIAVTALKIEGSAFLRYLYVVFFLYIILGIKDKHSNENRRNLQ